MRDSRAFVLGKEAVFDIQAASEEHQSDTCSEHFSELHVGLTIPMYSMCSLHAVRSPKLRRNAHAAGARISSCVVALDQIDGQTSPAAVVPTAMSSQIPQ